ncbi:MAG: GNAT family N-acetyltransferase, partial [Allosphingosinicella sp.]
FENVVPHEQDWAIALRPEDRFIGVVGLVPGGEEAELGYWLGRPWWGRGYATEACAALVSHAFGPLALRALVSGCFSDNPASAAVLRKLGFAQTGEGTLFCLAEGRELPFLQMRLERGAAR